MDIKKDDVFRSEEHLQAVKAKIRNEWLYPDAVEKLRELAEYADIVLFSEMPHDLVRVVREVLVERGIPVRAVGRIAVSAGELRRKRYFAFVLPIARRPVLWVDDPYARENFSEIMKKYPHIHLVIVRGRSGGEYDYERFAHIDVRKEIERAIRKWQEHKRYTSKF